MVKKTAVLIHGYNVNAPDWEWVVWGKPQDKVLGRAARGLELACANDADMLYIGGGGSEMDGMWEGEITYNYVLKHAGELHTFNVCNRSDMARILTGGCTHVDAKSKNTFDEIANFMRLCQEREIKQLIFVSSPFHGPRCQQIGDILRILWQDTALRVATITADTDSKGGTVSDVAVVEPQHWLNPQVRRIMHGISDERVPAFAQELDALVEKYTTT